MRDTDTFKVEKILKTKGRGQNKQYFVKWIHFPSKFNSWVKVDDVQNFVIIVCMLLLSINLQKYDPLLFFFMLLFPIVLQRYLKDKSIYRNYSHGKGYAKEILECAEKPEDKRLQIVRVLSIDVKKNVMTKPDLLKPH